MEVLSGHTSPETAYIISDYPYGFRLRCKIRYWLEYKPNSGYRLVSQSTSAQGASNAAVPVASPAERKLYEK